jgi:hypothetical protein
LGKIFIDRVYARHCIKNFQIYTISFHSINKCKYYHNSHSIVKETNVYWSYSGFYEITQLGNSNQNSNPSLSNSRTYSLILTCNKVEKEDNGWEGAQQKWAKLEKQAWEKCEDGSVI